MYNLYKTLEGTLEPDDLMSYYNHIGSKFAVQKWPSDTMTVHL